MDNQEKTDEELAGLVQTGGQAELGELIRRYQNKLYYYVLRLMGDSEQALDVVQDSFIRAYKNIQSFDTSRRFSPWIYRIAHNLAVNQLKKNSRSIAVNAPTLDWLEAHQVEIDDFIAKEERKELSADMISLLELIRPDYKEVLVLYYFEEKSYQEISYIMQIPETTVGVWLKRAKAQLKNELMKKYD